MDLKYQEEYFDKSIKPKKSLLEGFKVLSLLGDSKGSIEFHSPKVLDALDRNTVVQI